MKDKKRIIDAIWAPLISVALIAVFYYAEVDEILQLRSWGIRPRELKGIVGIALSPFLHGSFEHLFNNSLPLLVLGWALFYFYRDLAWRTIAWIILLGGTWVWLSARADTNHIGASGLLYGLVTFLFLSGVLRRHVPLIAISMLVVFLYGSLIWGILPIQEHVSWEGHLWGAVAGIVMAVYYRPEGPQRPVFDWENEAEDEDEDGPWNGIQHDEVTISNNARPVRIVYHVKKNATPSSPSLESGDQPAASGGDKNPQE